MEKSIKRVGNQFVKEESNKKEKKEKKKKRKKESEREEMERERGGKGNRRSNGRKSAFRRSELVGPRSKVCLFNEDYTPRGRDSSHFGLFSTIRVVGLCLCPKGLFDRISKYGNAALFCSYTLARF